MGDREKTLLPKNITIFDKFKDRFKRLMEFREGSRFILDTMPTLKKYTEFELMKIARIEEKLKNTLNDNNKSQSLQKGLKESEVKNLLEWVVQNARERLVSEKDKDISNDGLLGCCGLGQGITATTLKNMGLSPNVSNTKPTLTTKGSTRHAFVTVEIPVESSNGKIEEKLYLIDTTYRQFFIRAEPILPEYIKDKNFGNKVAPLAGYWLLKMDGGQNFAEEILSKGFIELNEKNAKLYGDSFELENKTRKNYTKVPSKKEMITNIDGKTYLQNMTKPELQEKLDHEEGELEEESETPLMKKQRYRQNEKQNRKKMVPEKNNKHEHERDSYVI